MIQTVTAVCNLQKQSHVKITDNGKRHGFIKDQRYIAEHDSLHKTYLIPVAQSEMNK